MNRSLKAVLAVSSILIVQACATSTPGDLPCEGDEDCPVGTICDLDQNQCVRVRLSSNSDSNGSTGTNNTNGNPFNDSTNNPLNNLTPDMGGDTSEDMGGSDQSESQDMPVVTCDPECEDDEVCDRGTCVSACDPMCEAPETCTADGCKIPDCSAAGDPCDATSPDQGEFACVQGDDEDVGVCLAKCDDPFAAGECPARTYCWTIEDTDVCIPKTCSSNGDCDQGSCVDFDNEFAICFQAGSLTEGAACDPDDNQCEEGTFCRETGPGTGVCSRFCDQWSNDPDCPAGEYCAIPFAPRTALCTSDTDSLAPTAPFITCDASGIACDHAVRCFSIGAQNGCLKYCRPGENDCDGVDADGDPTVCDNYAFGGQRAFGVCWPACDPMDPNPCGGGAVCVDELCRTTCDPANEIQDCCNGTACPFTCNPNTNLCE